MPTRNVVLTEHHETLIRPLVASGRYRNAGEVMRDALRSLERQEEQASAALGSTASACLTHSISPEMP